MLKDKMPKFPGIGMRIIKSAIAVALCIVVNLLRGADGMVFYSMLAALWCVQMYRNNTLANALQRTTGTIVGAVYGLLYILIYPYVVTNESRIVIEILCVFVGIVLVIYTTVLIRKNQAAYFSCVVFLSIIVNHIGDANPYFFVWNRFLDTMIGIAIGVCVNNIRICINPDRETLFVSGVEGILVNMENKISAFSKVELNRMIDDGLRFTISTMRTPASLLEPLSDIHFKYPVIVMDGAAIYDINKSEYVKEYVISGEASMELIALIHEYGMHPYTNVIIDDTLLIYYDDMPDEVNNNLVSRLRTSPYRNYIKREFHGNENVVYLMILDTTKRIENFCSVLREKGYYDRFKILTTLSADYKGYSYIKIYNKNSSKDNMLAYLQDKYKVQKILTFGTIPDKYDVIVGENDFNRMVRLLRKRYEPIVGRINKWNSKKAAD
ncbi:MAG: HAD hydrolase family protein [Lachnospiraceae bacterium]|nr:HAD hydrolase family protein [Candidatus Colinaster scatohippi]